MYRTLFEPKTFNKSSFQINDLPLDELFKLIDVDQEYWFARTDYIEKILSNNLLPNTSSCSIKKNETIADYHIEFYKNADNHNISKEGGLFMPGLIRHQGKFKPHIVSKDGIIKPLILKLDFYQVPQSIINLINHS